MEEKKKFEKPELQVVEMKLGPLAAGSGCSHPDCGSCEGDFCD